VRCVTRTT